MPRKGARTVRKRLTGKAKNTPPERRFSLRQLKYKKNRLLGMNQFNAAVAAGYSERTARQACKIENIVKSSIVDEIDRAGGTNKVLIQGLLSIATADMRRLYGKDGRMLPPHKWPDDLARCITSVETDELFDFENRTRVKVGESKKVRLSDRHKAFDTLCKLKKLTDQLVIDESEHTHFTVIVQGEGQGGSERTSQADNEAEFSVSTSD